MTRVEPTLAIEPNFHTFPYKTLRTAYRRSHPFSGNVAYRDNFDTLPRLACMAQLFACLRYEVKSGLAYKRNIVTKIAFKEDKIKLTVTTLSELKKEIQTKEDYCGYEQLSRANE